MKLTKQQIVNEWKSLKKYFKVVNDHSSKTGADHIDWRHKVALDEDYGNKASTRVSVSSDKDR